MNAAIISDPGKAATIAERRKHGVAVRQGRSLVLLSTEEIARLINFAHDGQPVTVSPVA